MDPIKNPFSPGAGVEFDAAALVEIFNFTRG
jgi:hypothetical protein